MKSLPSILFAFALAFTLSACSGSSDNPVSITPPTPDTGQSTPPPITSLWLSASGKTLDLRKLTLNQEASADLVLNCPGNYGNTGKVNGMQRGDVMISGSATAGYLFVGHLKYVGASDKTCSDMSKEIYSYSISDSTLTFCALNWDACGTYILGPQ